jgi:hypothetical protein
MVLALVFSAGSSVATGPQASRLSDREVTDLLERLEKNAAQFHRSLATRPDQEWIVRWEKTRNIDHFVARFVDATRRLRVRSDRRQVVTTRVDEVLRRGVSIDSFMERGRAADQAARDWAIVRHDLAELAVAFNVPWNRSTPRLTSARPAGADSWDATEP